MRWQAEIVSAHNPLLRELRRALGRGALTRAGQCVAEGFHLLEEALRSGLRVPAVLCAPEARERAEALVAGRAGTRLIAVRRELLERISAAETSQGVLALAEPPQWDAPELFRRPGPVVVLDRLQDPGNAGAIARAAEAFGAAGLVWVKGTVARWNAKTLRASAGSLFRLPCVDAPDAAAAAALLQQYGRAILIADARHGAAPWETGWRAPCALVIGNEARGPSAELASAGRPVHVPVAGVESLNAAVAAAVLLYEAMRQRGVR
ncbi:MAG: RNA methyltransferase [Bryobacteraceae bacterium]|nr:RNA methyltransferase [Bryobacteraceae bacterium]MCX7603279.1 RNA methyltransferase [Bryobacteraceae bacterium]